MSRREVDWADLMRSANAGDAAAYRRLLSELTPVLRSAARRALARGGMPAIDSEDVVQETLLAIHLKRHTWDTGAPIGPWVRAIARNKLVDMMRRRGRRTEVLIDDFTDVLASDTPMPDAAAQSRDVDRHLDGLPARQCAVVRAIAVQGTSITETAQRLDITEGAVRVALHRGLAALAKKFGS